MIEEFKLKTQNELVEEHHVSVNYYKYYRDQINLAESRIESLLKKQEKIKKDICFYKQIKEDYKNSLKNIESELNIVGIITKDCNGSDLL